MKDTHVYVEVFVSGEHHPDKWKDLLLDAVKRNSYDVLSVDYVERLEEGDDGLLVPPKPFPDCPTDCENVGHCASTEGCLERLENVYPLDGR